jgi:serine/threonine protein kinase
MRRATEIWNCDTKWKREQQAGSFLDTPALSEPASGVKLVGRQLGPYRILSPLGAGGMGEVYRAHGSKLRRDVAPKTLPPEFARDPDRMARGEEKRAHSQP